MRMIDADLLKRKPEEYAEITKDWEVTVKLETILNKFLRWIDTEQTVDAEPVRHGRWRESPMGLFRCSECDSVATYSYYYCHNCGAKMEESSEAAH